MEPDVIVNGQTLELHGQVVAVADSTEVKVTGNLAGYAFVDRANQANRFVLYANDNKVHIWKDDVGDVFSIAFDPLNHSVLGVKFITATGISIDGGGLLLRGISAGIDFRDQSEPVQSTYYNFFVKDGILHFSKRKVGDLFTVNNGEIEMKGQFSSYAFHDRNNPKNRFVMYAVDDTVRFWKEGVGDIFSINSNGSVVSNGIDLLKTIKELQERVKKLESKVGV